MCGFIEWPDAKTWTIRLSTRAVSQNELKGNGRGWSGHAYRSIRRRFERALVVAKASRIPRATGFRRLVCTRFFRNGRREFDVGNLVGGAKPLVDALKTAGIIVDDSPKHFAGYYLQKPSGTTSDYIVIRIEERAE